MPNELYYTAVNILEQSDHTRVNSLRKLYNITLNTDKELDSIITKLRKSDNLLVNTVKELNNKTLNILIKSDNTANVFIKSIVINILNTIKINLTTFDYNIINLNTTERKNNIKVNTVKIPVKKGDLIKAAATLFTIS
jgi:3-methyladenine DNA glycosylase AlkC